MFNRILNFVRQHKGPTFLLLVGLTTIHLPLIPSAFRQSTDLHAPTAGLFGDFVGGYFGTIFAAVGVYFLYLTLEDQRLHSKQQFFESRYFELIKLHRNNLDELRIKDVTARKVFVQIFNEFRATNRHLARVNQKLGSKLPRGKLMTISYYAVFYGLGSNSSRMTKRALTNIADETIDALVESLKPQNIRMDIRSNGGLEYVPLDGHQSRLGHYYRNLYQLVKYVDGCDLSTDEKYQYIKTVRAQLSTHEQALLLVNSLTELGEKWWAERLIDRYKLVKNIPKDFFDPELEFDITEIIDTRGYFEWDRTFKRSSSSYAKSLADVN